MEIFKSGCRAGFYFQPYLTAPFVCCRWFRSPSFLFLALSDTREFRSLHSFAGLSFQSLILQTSPQFSFICLLLAVSWTTLLYESQYMQKPNYSSKYLLPFERSRRTQDILPAMALLLSLLVSGLTQKPGSSNILSGIESSFVWGAVCTIIYIIKSSHK